MPDGSETFRQHPPLSVAVSWPNGSIDQPQRDVLAPIVLWHIRIGSVEDFAVGWRQYSDREPKRLGDGCKPLGLWILGAVPASFWLPAHG